MASPELSALLTLLGPPQPGANPSVEMRRAGFLRLSALMLPLPEDVTVTPTEIGGIPAEVTTIRDAEPPAGTLLFLHGGGFSVGSPLTHREFVGRLARASGLRVVSLDYRLAPEHPFPSALDDAGAAYDGVLAAGIPAQSIALAGDSAGGGLALSLLLSLRERGAPLPACAAAICPWADLSLSAPSLDENARSDPLVQRLSASGSVERYLGPSGDPRHPLASPVFADLAELPPLFLQATRAESLRDDALRLAENARKAGVEVELDLWEDMPHIWPFFAKMLPEGRAAIDRVGTFLRRRVKAPARLRP